MSGATETKEINSLSLYMRLLTYVKPVRFAFLLGIFGYIIYSCSNIWFFDLLETLIDMVEGGNNIPTDVRLGIPLTLIAIIASRGFGGFLGAYYMAYLANHVVHRVRCQIIDRFLTLPVSFYDQRTGGHLVSMVTYNVGQLSFAVTEALTVILREGLLVLGLICFLLYLNWKLTLIFIAVMPAISLVILYAAKKFKKHSNRIQISMGDVTHILTETIKGFRVIRTFGAEKQVANKFKEVSELNLKQNLKMESISAISTPIVQLVVGAALALLIWFALSPTVLEGMTSGKFVVFISVAGALLKPVRQLSKINAVLQKGLAAAKTIFDLLDEKEENNTGTFEIERVQGKVEFKNVNFSYDVPAEGTKAHVLKNINFTCDSGKTVALVGKSGSGKSTLVNLISRFYEVDQGQILIDDTSHTDFALQNLRQQISLVSQQVVLFNGSIRDNIAYGSLADASDEDILQALKHANAMEFIETLPEGIDTQVGDDATLLSGGQRQRLAIARALLKDAPILILDEATSALDSVSERSIQGALETLMAGRTTFVVAHRLSTIEKADSIIVMSEGQIVETGSHQELLGLQGEYSRLHKMQFTEQ